jgi:hypothetical protein
MQQVSHSTTIEVNTTPDEALPLFTAVGERLWIKEWDPAYIYPESGEPMQGMIWKTTNAAGIDEIWVTVTYDVEQHAACYVKWSPEKHVTRIDVDCDAIDDDRTRVQVTYTITALSEEGLAQLKHFTKAHYERMIKPWQGAVNHYLETGEASYLH